MTATVISLSDARAARGLPARPGYAITAAEHRPPSARLLNAGAWHGVGVCDQTRAVRGTVIGRHPDSGKLLVLLDFGILRYYDAAALTPLKPGPSAA